MTTLLREPRPGGGLVMQRFNLSAWAITHQPLVLFMIIVLGAAGALRLPQPRPRRGPLLHHQDDGGERRLARRDGRGDAGAGRRPDREEAAGAALSRPRRKLFAAGRHLHPRQPHATRLRPPRSRTSGTRCARRSATSAASLPPASSAPVSTTSSATSIRRSTC